MRGVPWTDRQIAVLIECRRYGLAWPAVADRVGKSADNCKAKYGNLQAAGRVAAGRRAASKEIPNATRLNFERREEARRRQSLTGQIFGDPPPGFSALDRRGYG